MSLFSELDILVDSKERTQVPAPSVDDPASKIILPSNHSSSFVPFDISEGPPSDPEPSSSSDTYLVNDFVDIPEHMILQPGSWVIGNRIGKGGWCYVFEGTLGDRPVAIKLLQEQLRNFPKDIFCREVNQWSQFDHPAIVKLVGAALQPEMVMVMELLSLSLKSRLRKFPPLPFSTRLSYSCQIADAVNFLHSKQIIHRDLKPANFLLTFDEQYAKLSDFGTTRALNSEGRFGNTLRTGLQGTLGYLSPEIFTHPAEQTPAVDIFALGVSFYEILVHGDRSWRYFVDQDALQFNVRPQAPENMTPFEQEYFSLIERCWQHDPSLRPTAFYVLSRLQSMISYDLVLGHS
jgi:serine/threonine protein kinase